MPHIPLILICRVLLFCIAETEFFEIERLEYRTAGNNLHVARQVVIVDVMIVGKMKL